MDILQDREERFLFEKKLFTAYKHPIIVISSNYPGQNKQNIYTTFIVYCLYMDIMEKLKAQPLMYSFDNEGFIIHLLSEEEPKKLKEELVLLEENHPLGRLADLDVFFGTGNISRRDIALPKRTCFLCEEPAHECVRSKKHSYEDVTSFIHKNVTSYIFQKPVKRLAMFGMINEVVREHGFGCVTVLEDGNHKDMNFETFLQSIKAISHSLDKVDLRNTIDFIKLRNMGIKIEKDMFLATKGINTHKGFIFSYLFFIYAFLHSENLQDMQTCIKDMAKNILDDFNEKADTNGHRIYEKHAILGVRGLAYSGYDNVFNKYLPFFKETNDLKKLYLYIMSDNLDTTVIVRSSLKELYTLQKHAKLAYMSCDVSQLNKFIFKYNISTGGTADLYAIVLILYIMEKYYLYF